jgi:hypothetical protein
MLRAFVRDTERATHLIDALGANRPVALEHQNLLLALGDELPRVDVREVAALAPTCATLCGMLGFFGTPSQVSFTYTGSMRSGLSPICWSKAVRSSV